MNRSHLNIELNRLASAMPAIDAHSHLSGFENDCADSDFFAEYLSGNFNCDLLSTGMPADDLKNIISSNLSVEEKWHIAEPYWERCRNTGYGIALDKAVQALYNIDNISGNTVVQLNKSYRTLHRQPCLPFIIKQLSHVEQVVIDSGNGKSNSLLFRRVYRLDEFIYLRNKQDIEALSLQWNTPIESLEDLLDVLDKAFENAVHDSPCGFKISVSYFRTLKIDVPDFVGARQQFLSLKRDRAASALLVQNCVLHRLFYHLNRHHMLLQIHTGMHEGHGNLLMDSNPLLLEEIIMAYPNVTFDLFHCGYPFVDSLAALARKYKNVYLNMCWMHSISPAAARQTLFQWLSIVSHKKIIAMGSDNHFADIIPGHRQLTNENLSYALTCWALASGASIDKLETMLYDMLYATPAMLYR